MPGYWTEPREERLFEYVSKTVLSGAKIAAAMSRETGQPVTRNAIIGKIHRKHWEELFARQRATSTETVRPALVPRRRVTAIPFNGPIAQRTAPVKVAIRSADQATPVAQRRTLQQLDGNTCRWPIGDPRGG